MTISLAGIADFDGILALHKTYHTDGISPQDRPDGFVTTNFTPAQLESLIVQERGVTVARDETGRIAAYAMAASWAFWAEWPLFEHMIEKIAGVFLERTNVVYRELK